MLNTVAEVLRQYDGQYEEIEVYAYRGSNRKIHTDEVKAIDVNLSSILDQECDAELMDEDDYNTSILANSSESADFGTWYDDADAKVLVIVLSWNWEEV